MAPNLDDLYLVLRAWAVAKQNQTRTYAELSQDYKVRTGDWFEPHGSWDQPLGELNRRLHAAARAPALSALVVLGATKEPGGGFWGSAPGVPPRPTNDLARLTEWQRIVKAVLKYPWPPVLP
jgi:hypothetical protein